VPAPPLDELPPVRIDRVQLAHVPMALSTPLGSAGAARTERDVLLVNVGGPDGEGWSECVAEPEPSYAPETARTAALVLRHHLVPLLWGRPVDAVELECAMSAVRGNQMARAALELAVLDAQLRVAGRSLASWLGATSTAVSPGAVLGLHADDGALVVEARQALEAGAARLRVKVAPGRAAGALATLRHELGDEVPLQADANGSFRVDEPDHLVELDQVDELGLTCLEQPLAPDDLLGTARLAERMTTPICLDEPITSLDALEAAVALGACEVLCLKPGRVGGWLAARRIHHRCAELDLPVWVGGMLETGVGRAANLALAALPGMALAPDLDPRGRFDPDLADSRLPVDGLVAVPDEPGTGAWPEPAGLLGAQLDVLRPG
jgi:o-succinylbenzoate synthase